VKQFLPCSVYTSYPVLFQSQPTRTAKQGRRYVTRDSSTSPASEENQERRYEARIRLASSDLDDSEEIWTEELGRYILENRLRARDVEAWFENKSAVRMTYRAPRPSPTSFLFRNEIKMSPVGLPILITLVSLLSLILKAIGK
jgi:hypothetical protein